MSDMYPGAGLPPSTFEWIGKIIVQWSILEFQISDIVVILENQSGDEMTAIQTDSFATKKKKALESLQNSNLSEKAKKQCQEILRIISILSIERNFFAHMLVAQRDPKKGAELWGIKAQRGQQMPLQLKMSDNFLQTFYEKLIHSSKNLISFSISELGYGKNIIEL